MGDTNNCNLAELKGHAGIATYHVNHATGCLNGRFALALYKGAVALEDGAKRKGSGPEGSIEGVYDITTYDPEGGTFATGTLQLCPIEPPEGKTPGAFAVLWVLHPTEENQKKHDFPDTMVYDACGLAIGDSTFAIGWDNNDYRCHVPRLARLR